MTLKMSKCVFAKPEINFIGHRVGQGKRTPIINKIEAIRNIPVPVTKKILKRFLAMIGFYRQYICHFAETSHPLTELTNKSWNFKENKEIKCGA